MPANEQLALIFDVDGTLADTESAHREAFNEAFAEAGLPWRWSEAEYIRLLAVSGGRERIAAYWRQQEPEAGDDAARRALVERVHALKTLRYAEKVGQGQLPLRPGVLRLLQQARDQGLPLALATTTTPANIDALLRVPLGPHWRALFAAVADAGTAPRKKPDPQVYSQVLSTLGRAPRSCLAFEDSENGLRAACAAGVPTIVTPTAFTAHDDFTGALQVLPDLAEVQLHHLEALIG